MSTCTKMSLNPLAARLQKKKSILDLLLERLQSWYDLIISFNTFKALV